jgi:hypothetical protein
VRFFQFLNDVLLLRLLSVELGGEVRGLCQFSNFSQGSGLSAKLLLLTQFRTQPHLSCCLIYYGSRHFLFNGAPAYASRCLRLSNVGTWAVSATVAQTAGGYTMVAAQTNGG